MHKTLLIFYFQIASLVLVAQTVVLPPYFGVASSDFKCGKSKVVDSEGNSYATVKIGDQCWMAENLKYIPSVHPPTDETSISARFYVYGYYGTSVDDAKATENYNTFGVLYNWPAATISCPAGWHIPDISEWNELISYCGGQSIAGGKLKEAGTEHWESPNTGANNETGFTALPGGGCSAPMLFFYLGVMGHWWTSTGNSDKYRVQLDALDSGIYQYLSSRKTGFSVRCIKD